MTSSVAYFTVALPVAVSTSAMDTDEAFPSMSVTLSVTLCSAQIELLVFIMYHRSLRSAHNVTYLHDHVSIRSTHISPPIPFHKRTPDEGGSFLPTREVYRCESFYNCAMNFWAHFLERERGTRLNKCRWVRDGIIITLWEHFPEREKVAKYHHQRVLSCDILKNKSTSESSVCVCVCGGVCACVRACEGVCVCVRARVCA